jgi:hypothetical protein
MSHQDKEELNEEERENSFFEINNLNEIGSSQLLPFQNEEDNTSSVDYVAATTEFAREFEKKYCTATSLYPHFFTSSFEEVRDIAKSTGKFMMLYVYDGNDSEAELFCSQILCSEAIVQFFQVYCLCWGWDRTQKDHYTALRRLLQKELYSQSYDLCSINGSFLVALATIKGRLTVLESWSGLVLIDELLKRLIWLVETYESDLEETLQAIVQREITRAQREQLKREQEAAFQSSLEIDHRKAEEIKEALRREQEEKELQLRKKKEELERREQLVAALPSEPSKDEKQPISELVFRLPNGEKLQRRFLASTALQVLFIYRFPTQKLYVFI